jgi:hypothetical protein
LDESLSVYTSKCSTPPSIGNQAWFRVAQRFMPDAKAYGIVPSQRDSHNGEVSRCPRYPWPVGHGNPDVIKMEIKEWDTHSLASQNGSVS